VVTSTLKGAKSSATRCQMRWICGEFTATGHGVKTRTQQGCDFLFMHFGHKVGLEDEWNSMIHERATVIARLVTASELPPPRKHR
jgi:hypothetical protein